MLRSCRVFRISVFVLFSYSASLIAQGQLHPNKVEHSVSIYAIGNYTSVSRGEFTSGRSILQTDKAAVGTAGYFASWRGSNGLIAGGSYTNTESRLMNLSGVLIDFWKLQRYKADLFYEHRFFMGRRFQPHLGFGGFLIVLWGGDAPAHSNVNRTGWDSLRGLVVPAGVTTRVNERVSLKTGVLVDFGRASTYSDQTYKSSRNLMYEPQIGVSFRVGRSRGREW